MLHNSTRALVPLVLVFLSRLANAQEAAPPPIPVEEVVVYGRAMDLVGEAEASSDGQVGAAELAARPFLRRGELLEVIPGVVITQHSGSGKANQYFLRGFNLDHGTDFAIHVDGMPVNLRSHAHGQGYSDLNFIISELVQSIAYQKGSHAAANGDFSAAGAAQFHFANTLAQGLVKVEAGENEFARMVVADSIKSGTHATTLFGAEVAYSNGPWVSPEHSRRLNGMFRQTWTAGSNEFAVTALAYHGRWGATDQVPQRAVDSGQIGRLGLIDPSGGGASERGSLSFDWKAEAADTVTKINAYAIYYRLNLFSNFTYFLEDPANGDQFRQRDKRGLFGASLERTRTTSLSGRKLENTLGLQLRHDSIGVALRRTAQHVPLATVRTDAVEESSAGIFASSTLQASDAFRINAGMRGDFYRFDVESDNPLNSGRRTAAIASPKLGMIFRPWTKTEFYLDGGYGFHSNDARGTVITVSPVDGSDADRVNPLVRARSLEAGLRTSLLPGLVSTVSLWQLELDSELVFVGDGGNTEATGATRRYGIEFANFYRAFPWLAFDADLALTHARYRHAPGADRIPNSIATVITGGTAVDLWQGFFGSVRARYFGPQPLIEDNSVGQPSSLTFNARIGWRGSGWELGVDVLNVLDRQNNDIAYYYGSRLPGEPLAGFDDIHAHPAEPRTFRFSATRRF